MGFRCYGCKEHFQESPQQTVTERQADGKQIKKEVNFCEKCAITHQIKELTNAGN